MRLTITGLSYTLLIITEPHDDSCIVSHSKIQLVEVAGLKKLQFTINPLFLLCGKQFVSDKLCTLKPKNL